MTPTDNPRDALAAKYFPAEWARVCTAPGKSKQRQKLRKEAETAQTVEVLAAAGSRCANCRSFNTREVFGLKMKAHCDYQSDFHGYVEAKPDELCVHWSAKK